MSAVQLNTLKLQIAQLAELFQHSQDFCASINHLLSQYADLTYQAGDEIAPIVIIPAYRVPPIVMRHLEIALQNWTKLDPVASLENSDMLWSYDVLEDKELSAFILGQIPVPPFAPILTRIQQRFDPQNERAINIRLIDKGSRKIRLIEESGWYETIQNWMLDNNSTLQSIGMSAMITSITDPEFKNLPAIFKIISNTLPRISTKKQWEMDSLIEILAKISPHETAHLFRQMISTNASPELIHIIRRNIQAFPPSIQASLRESFEINKPG